MSFHPNNKFTHLKKFNINDYKETKIFDFYEDNDKDTELKNKMSEVEDYLKQFPNYKDIPIFSPSCFFQHKHFEMFKFYVIIGFFPSITYGNSMYHSHYGTAHKPKKYLYILLANIINISVAAIFTAYFYPTSQAVHNGIYRTLMLEEKVLYRYTEKFNLYQNNDMTTDELNYPSFIRTWMTERAVNKQVLKIVYDSRKDFYKKLEKEGYKD